MNEIVIPPSTLQALAGVPLGESAAVLIRHSAREKIPNGINGDLVPLTDHGRAMARELGAILGPRVVRVHSSPIPRCLDTAQHLLAGAAQSLPVVHDQVIAASGEFIEDPEVAYGTWTRVGHFPTFEALMRGQRLPGYAEPKLAAQRFVQHLIAHLDQPGLHVFVSHDSPIACLWAQLRERPLEQPEWPLFLEAMVVRRQGNRAVASYRDEQVEVATAQLISAVQP
jgi:broad specificity phosphatase PhoE